MNKSTNEKGATLIEVLGVLCIVATIAAGAYAGISRMNQKIKLTQAHAEVSNLVKDIRTHFSSSRPATISAKQLYDLGILKNINDEETAAANVYGGEIRVLWKEINGNPAFSIDYYNVPPKACIDLLMADWGNDPSSGLYTIYVAPYGPNYKAFYWKKDFPNCETDSYMHCLPPSFEDASEECTRAQAGAMTWEYYL